MTKPVLLLQGPIGSFFKRLSFDLTSSGHTVYKVNFNGGDEWFYKDDHTIRFTGCLDDWENWLESKIDEYGISRIYLFGDCRPHHQIARTVAQKRDLKVFVFECGYIRPDYITLEEGGVNGFSSLSRDPNDYSGIIATPPRRRHALHGEFPRSAVQAVIYYLASATRHKQFPNYQHHRPLNTLIEGSRWLRSFLSRPKSHWKDLQASMSIFGSDKPYYLVPLQVHNDSQVIEHSPFEDVADFIRDVVKSFAKSASPQTNLVFKHHPHDRAYRHYGSLLKALSQNYGVFERVYYVHDPSLPKLLKQASGVITINSTVGLSALHHNTPVIALGNAIYDMEGLCFQGDLDSFWQKTGTVNRDLFYRFRAYLLRHNQIEGSLYQKLSPCDRDSGLRWPEYLRKEHLDHHNARDARIGEARPKRISPKTA